MRFLASSNQKLPFGQLDSKHQGATASWCDNYTDVKLLFIIISVCTIDGGSFRA